jgi:hypothetical protein
MVGVQSRYARCSDKRDGVQTLVLWATARLESLPRVCTNVARPGNLGQSRLGHVGRHLQCSLGIGILFFFILFLLLSYEEGRGPFPCIIFCQPFLFCLVRDVFLDCAPWDLMCATNSQVKRTGTAQLRADHDRERESIHGWHSGVLVNKKAGRPIVRLAKANQNKLTRLCCSLGSRSVKSPRWG